MFNLWVLMEDPVVAGFVSFMIGFGLAAMFRPMCRGADCVVIQGPPVRDVIDKVYQMGESCVEFTTEVITCPKDATDIIKTVTVVASK